MNVSFPAHPPRLIKVSRRPGLQAAREVSVHIGRVRQAGRGPLAVFLPAYGRQGAALLRIYNLAEALRPMGWRTLVLPPTLGFRQRLRILAQAGADVIVMQGVRHVLNRPALYPGVPVVFDMDDADFHLPHLSDAVSRAMPSVAAVIAGSRYVADWCRANGAGEAHVVWTGTPVSDGARSTAVQRGPVIAWAQTRPMTYVREADLVAQAVRALAARHPGLRLRLYDRRDGDDPGFARRFEAPGLTVEWRDSVDYAGYASFDDVALGLAPLCPETPFSRGKSFGKVLAYLDRAVPVIGSDAGEHGRFFTPETGVISNATSHWVSEMDRLLRSAEARQTMAVAAFGDFRRRLSLAAAAEQTSGILGNLLTRKAAHFT